MRKRTVTLAVATVAIASTIALAGCTSQPTPSPSQSASSTAAPDLSQLTPAPSGAPVDQDSGGGTVAPQPAPPWDAEQRKAAIAAATAAMAAFARPDLASTDWWAALSPLLTSQAQQDYQAVDPANIGAREVTGQASIVDESSSYAVTVTVPTNSGEYTVVLTRDDGASPWLAARFTPPEGTH